MSLIKNTYFRYININSRGRLIKKPELKARKNNLVEIPGMPSLGIIENGKICWLHSV